MKRRCGVMCGRRAPPAWPGVFSGTTLWFLVLSFGVSRGHGRFGEKTLLRLQHLSGLCLITTALIEGVKIALDLTKHKM
jgi:hypothetical protein